MRLPLLAALFALLLAACQSPQPIPRTPDEEDMFGPLTMRLHPTFTQVKNWTGGPRPDGVEAVVEFDDRFHEPTKAAGTLIFELFQFRKGFADPRGLRLLEWPASIATFDEQQAHWHREYGAYSFLLADPDIRADKNYVLTATFQSLSDKRFTDQTILVGVEHKKKYTTSPADESNNGSPDSPGDSSHAPPDRQSEP
jgi:hypothetical protein